MRTAIDTNILFALWGGEPSAPQISQLLYASSAVGGLVIHPIVYIESRAHPKVSAAIVDRFLRDTRIDVDWFVEQQVWLLAAERFERYVERRRGQGGEAKRFPADFLVAAHALLKADRLVTLDQRRYRTDFPELTLMEP
ncbi:MAG: type II toxin-antitoxin system VapC family toxin [Acidobacteriota bacterium]